MTEIANYIDLVAEMRQTQIEYFLKRSSALLYKAKALEKRVDKLTPIIKRKISEKLPIQTTFDFGEL